MKRGLLHLASYGPQDIYLTGNPQITFFKAVYHRHTNFSIESIEQKVHGTANFGERIFCTISKNADLIHQINLEITLPNISPLSTHTDDGDPNSFAWIKKLGFYLIDYIDLEIGGNLIDRHYGDWLNIWSELTENKLNKESGFDSMIGNVKEMYTFSNSSSSDEYIKNKKKRKIYIPLQFWFCRNPGLAIPLVSLVNDEITLIIKFRKRTDLYLYNDYSVLIANNNNTNIIQADNITNSGLEKGTIISDKLNRENTGELQLPLKYMDSRIYYEPLTGTFNEKSIIQYYDSKIDKYIDINKNGFEITNLYTIKSLNSNIIADNIPEVGLPIGTIIRNKNDDSKKGIIYATFKYNNTIIRYQPVNGEFTMNDIIEYYDSTEKIYKNISMSSNGFQISYPLSGQTSGSKVAKELYPPYRSDKELEIKEFKIYVDYIYLDDKERAKFTLFNHEYLIDQIQYVDYLQKDHSILNMELDFKNPCKELIWTIQSNDNMNKNQWDNYTTISYSHKLDKFKSGENPLQECVILLNGKYRFSGRNSNYFNYIQPSKYHTRIPSKGINIYSFSLNPSEKQPMGSCNMSRIDNIILSIKLKKNILNNIIRIYSISYNILSISGGMGKLVYT